MLFSSVVKCIFHKESCNHPCVINCVQKMSGSRTEKTVDDLLHYCGENVMIEGFLGETLLPERVVSSIGICLGMGVVVEKY